jgi:hypothetical protein
MNVRVGEQARVLACFAALLIGCSSDDDNDGDNKAPTTITGTGGTGNAGMTATSGSGGAAAGTGGKDSGSGGKGASPNLGSGGATSGSGGDGAAGMGSGGMEGGSGGATSGTPTQPAGPEDGDPSKPIVAVTEVACGGPAGAFGLGAPNFKIDDRDVMITYPCNKHAGAPVTFILNLHGTTPVEQHFYQHGYFSAWQFAESHNLIVVEGSAIATQWGREDNGEDEPYLMDVIDWVYANLNGPDKFDIRAMWVGGHSWGGGYTATFGCKPELADKVKGLIMMSGGGIPAAGGGFSFGGAACADKVSVILTMAEGDNRMPADQSALAMSHGCGATQTEMILTTNVHTFWDECNPGFAHANYYMMGKEHATFMDKEVVESIVNWVKIARQ